MFKCKVCPSAFTRKDSLSRHEKIHSRDQFTCNVCNKIFSFKTNLKRHEKNVHHIFPAPAQIVPATPSATQQWVDDGFDEDFANFVFEGTTNKRVFDENTETALRNKRIRMSIAKTPSFVEIHSAHNRKVVCYYRKNIEKIQNYTTFLSTIKSQLLEKLQHHIQQHPIKYYLKLEATYNQPHVENSSENRAFKTPAREVFEETDFDFIINVDFNKLLREEDQYAGKGSGFTLQSIDGLMVGVYEYIPTRGRSYIALPTDIQSKYAVINPQNNDQQCFKWAILAKHVNGENKHRVGDNYKSIENKYNFTGLDFPTPLSNIKIFEKNNHTTSVNIYALKEEKIENRVKNIVYPLKVVDEEKLDHFDLLLIKNGENVHYAFISNFSRLIRSQKTLHKEKIFICKRCFTSFDDQPKKYKLSGQEALDEHKLICGQHKPILPQMPKEGEILEFEGWSKTQHHPFVIYADFEALLVKEEVSRGSNTSTIQKHEAMSFGYYVKSAEFVPIELLEKFNIPREPVIYRGNKDREDVARRFVEGVTNVTLKIKDLLKTNIPIIMTDEEKQSHGEKTECDLCKIRFNNTNHKVADHYHLSGKFRQTLCNTCNLKLQMPNFVPCFLHNLSNYDAHFIVTELGYDKKSISVIPNSEEKFISFSKNVTNDFQIRFLDSCRFMASSSSTLAKNLITKAFNKFRETRKVFDGGEMNLVTRKGVYPYEYTDTWEKLEEKVLPPKTEFYSTLTENNICDKEYEHAETVWSHFNCTTLGEYSDLYLKIDVLLLADVFENFRDICMKTYNLDPAFYYTAPGMSFDCMLKYTNIKLELLSDYDMHLMFEDGIRGGLTQASMRYAKANNEKMETYDSSKEDSWIVYQDCNNLYGWAMSQYMPYGGFQWVEPTLDGLNNLTDTSDVGRMYEVDISYPQHLHDEHNDLPFLPNNGIPPGSKIKKLMATLEPKKNYIIHYRNLKQAMANGLIVDKVHRVLEFKQSPWLKKYIDLNTEMRQAASNDFEKDFYKLMNNAVFGKTMESMRKRKKMELVTCPRRFQKLVNRPTFKHSTEYNENLSAVSLENKIIEFRKPIYVGFAVLDVSKTMMYDYHYNVMKKHYSDSINLMYTDTDSLIYYIRTKDFYTDLKDNSVLFDRMDTANLPRDHPCHTSIRKKVPGFFSDETDGRIITEFIALRAKAYSYILENVEKIKAKGIRGHVVKNHMTFEDHKRCLFREELNPYRENVSIRSFQHQIHTIKSNKLTYNRHDDKRKVLPCQIKTLAWGNYLIDELMDEDLNFV